MRWQLTLFCVLALTLGLGAWFWLLDVERVENSATAPYSLIEDGLYLGGAVVEPPPGTKAAVNVCGQKDSYSVEACIWEPIDGSDPPSVDWLRKVVKFIDDERSAGRTVYVHCLAGMNRNGMVVAAYLMHEHAWNAEQALAFARKKRPQVQPNPGMMRLLGEWEKALASSTTR